MFLSVGCERFGGDGKKEVGDERREVVEEKVEGMEVVKDGAGEEKRQDAAGSEVQGGQGREEGAPKQEEGVERKPTPPSRPTPIPYIPRKEVYVSQFYNGVVVEAGVRVQTSNYTASLERRSLGSYVLKMDLEIQLPVAAMTMEQIRANDPGLVGVLPNLEMLLEVGRVSPAFQKIYDNKVEYVKRKLSRLEEILSRHNFYDCDTILELKNPQTGRLALMISADMDVNEDGSDGDRNVRVEPTSVFFRPTTSYRWPKRTERPNPFLGPTEERLVEVRKRIMAAKEGEREILKREEQRLVLLVRELKRWSFLVSSVDPFIVLPGFLFRDGGGEYRPSFGDYAAVVHGERVYPAIVGDAGPSHKAGEASLRICREIEPATSAQKRAISDIRVHYFVFPGTAEEKAEPPDMGKWNRRVQELWVELGGRVEDVRMWEEIVPLWPEEDTRGEGKLAATEGESKAGVSGLEQGKVEGGHGEGMVEEEGRKGAAVESEGAETESKRIP
ncbi:MAG: glycoside hydrolase family 75 protein [Chthoniobacterales bacterium]|nr:glycoside hydrolase family 75 protein [Chthoniobacterales bacterium]